MEEIFRYLASAVLLNGPIGHRIVGSILLFAPRPAEQLPAAATLALSSMQTKTVPATVLRSAGIALAVSSEKKRAKRGIAQLERAVRVQESRAAALRLQAASWYAEAEQTMRASEHAEEEHARAETVLTDRERSIVEREEAAEAAARELRDEVSRHRAANAKQEARIAALEESLPKLAEERNALEAKIEALLRSGRR